MTPSTHEDLQRLIDDAQGLNLRSSIHQHAKLLDEYARRVSPISIPAEMAKIILALLDEHEAMNRRLADALTAQSTEIEAEAEKHEQHLGEVIDERDTAESGFGQAFYLVTGRSPEWSNIFGATEALEEIDDAQSTLRQTIAIQSTEIEALKADNARMGKALQSIIYNCHLLDAGPPIRKIACAALSPATTESQPRKRDHE